MIIYQCDLCGKQMTPSQAFEFEVILKPKERAQAGLAFVTHRIQQEFCEDCAKAAMSGVRVVMERVR